MINSFTLFDPDEPCYHESRSWRNCWKQECQDVCHENGRECMNGEGGYQCNECEALESWRW